MKLGYRKKKTRGGRIGDLRGFAEELFFILFYFKLSHFLRLRTLLDMQNQ
jgi:hypothetical protein